MLVEQIRGKTSSSSLGSNLNKSGCAFFNWKSVLTVGWVSGPAASCSHGAHGQNQEKNSHVGSMHSVDKELLGIWITIGDAARM